MDDYPWVAQLLDIDGTNICSATLVSFTKHHKHDYFMCRLAQTGPSQPGTVS